MSDIRRLNTAEDLAEVISLNESVTVPYGSFSNCRKTKETSSLEPDLLECESYCPGVGLVLTIDVATGERSELIAKKRERLADRPPPWSRRAQTLH